MTFRFDLPAKVTLMARLHPERKRRICTRNEGAGKASSWSDSEGSIAVVRKTVKCHQRHRFFTLCHRSAFPFFPQNILTPVQNDALGEDAWHHPHSFLFRLIHTLAHKIVSAVPTYHCGRSSFILAASFLCCTSFSTIRKKADPDPVIIVFLQREDR